MFGRLLCERVASSDVVPRRLFGTAKPMRQRRTRASAKKFAASHVRLASSCGKTEEELLVVEDACMKLLHVEAVTWKFSSSPHGLPTVSPLAALKRTKVKRAEGFQRREQAG